MYLAVKYVQTIEFEFTNKSVKNLYKSYLKVSTYLCTGIKIVKKLT